MAQHPVSSGPGPRRPAALPSATPPASPSISPPGSPSAPAAAPPAVPPATLPAGPAPALRLEGLRRGGRGGAPALDGLDLTVAPAEFVTLLGPAGAGKSLAVGIVAGSLAPDAGAVLIRGESQGDRPTWRRDIGLVADRPDLFPWLDLLANVALPLRARGVARAEREERAGATLARLGLPSALWRAAPAALSPAQRLRAALARAVVHAPAVLLLDDPLRALAGEERDALAGDLRRLQRGLGLAVLHAARDAPLALALSDRVAVLEGGRLRQVGTPRALYDAPADPAVAALTGPCNRLAGTVIAIGEDACHLRLDGGPEVAGVPVAGPAGPPAPGGRATLVVRPEEVAVAPVLAAEMGEGALPARLLESRFAGDHLRLRLELAPGVEILAHRPPGLPLPAAGAEAAVAWNPAAARIHAG